MALSYVNGSSNGSAGTTSLTVPVPTLIQAGDVAFVTVSCNNIPTLSNGGGGTNDLTPERQDGYASNGAKGGIFFRRLDGTETGNFTITLSATQRCTATCVVLRGVEPSGSPFDVTPALLTSGSGTVPQGASINIATAGAWIIGVAMMDSSGTITWGVPSTWNNRQSQTTNQASIAADQVFASAGASGTFDFSSTSGNWAVYGMAVKPAAAGGISIPVVFHHRNRN